MTVAIGELSVSNWIAVRLTLGGCGRNQKMLDIGEEELENMSTQDLESYEWSRMEKHAKKVCEEVSSRVDEAPTIYGYMKSMSAKIMVISSSRILLT